MQKSFVQLSAQVTMYLNGSQINENKIQNYTFTANTDSISPEGLIQFSFLLFKDENDLHLDQPDSNFTKGLAQFTNQTLSLINLQLIFCQATLSGNINFCQVPSYLNREDYELMLTLASQFLPNLQKSLYQTRRLQDGQGGTLEYSYAVDESSMSVALNNNLQTNNITGSNGNNSMSVDSNTVLDAITGEPISAKMSSDVSLKEDPNDENSLISGATSTSSTAVTMQPSVKTSDCYTTAMIALQKIMTSFSPAEMTQTLI
jgi:hypothetical protein